MGGGGWLETLCVSPPSVYIPGGGCPSGGDPGKRGLSWERVGCPGRKGVVLGETDRSWERAV